MLSIKMQNVDKVFMALAKNIKFGTFKYNIIYILNAYKMQILPFWVLNQIQKTIYPQKKNSNSRFKYK